MGDYQLIRYQILQTYIMRTVSPTVKRIINEILGVKVLKLNGDYLIPIELTAVHLLLTLFLESDDN